jgi:hypothetical protein
VIQSNLDFAHAAQGRWSNRAGGKPLTSRSGMPLTISRWNARGAKSLGISFGHTDVGYEPVPMKADLLAVHDVFA